ncbi:hypothetical protein HYV22_00910 [Candidatus Gottesmanbacteria bacterium]|nr:hypothetical protein [Candidatus Gottesmanbacteria bacterium]
MHAMIIFLTLIFFSSAFIQPAAAYQPVIEVRGGEDAATSSDPYELYGSAMVLGDPTFASYGVFGKLDAGEGVDLYVFTAQHEDTIPIGLNIPAKEQYARFRPTLTIIGPYVANGAKNQSPMVIPVGLESVTSGVQKTTTYDGWSLQTVYRGASQTVRVLPGVSYYLAVVDPDHLGGPYILRLGSKKNWRGSVKDTGTPVDVNTLVFEGYPARLANTPSPFEKQLLTEQKTPFQTFDSKLRLWSDLFFFYVNRLVGLITNQ